MYKESHPEDKPHQGASGRKRHPSIRSALIAAVCLAMAPALGIMILTGVEYSRALSDKAKSDSARQVEAFAHIQIRITESTRQILSTIAALPGLRDLQYGHVSEILKLVHEQNPDYLNFTEVDSGGTVVSSSLLPLGLYLGDRFHFREAMDRDAFSAGKYLINMIDATPSIAYAYPVKDRNGKSAGALAAIIKLDHYAMLFQELKLPAGSILSLLDADGRRLYFYPPKDSNPVGTMIMEGMWNRMTAGGDSGAFTETGSDQVERYYSFRKLRLDPARNPYMYIVYGVPVDATDATSRMVMTRNLLLLLIVTVFGLLGAGFLSRLLFGKRLDRIIATTARIREGNLAARAGLEGDTSDLGQIAKALDLMASTIEHRDHERMEHAKTLSSSLAEKEVLLREIHHRVKNNLQLIQSLLVLQSESPDDLRAFEQRMSSRIRAMAIVHQMLYESENLSVVDLGRYARQLVELLSGLFQGTSAVSVTVDACEVLSDIDTAVPFGLMLNELVTNAWKHAFGHGEGGILRIRLASVDGSVSLEVSDDGPGLPADFAISESSSLGLRLAQALSLQLGGSLAWTSDAAGTAFRAVFPVNRKTVP
jgi:two-component sensor histidine kinase